MGESQYLRDSNNNSQILDEKLKIAIFYDKNYTAPWITYSEELASSLNESFNSYSLDCSIYNDNELYDFVLNYPRGILINTMGILPYTLWNGSDNSLIENWIDMGGILVWTGCEEFYWVSYQNGTNKAFGHSGSEIVMDMEYLKIRSNQNVNPTLLGSYYISNITSHTSDIFTSIQILNNYSVHYEAYANSGDLADPILFQPYQGDGYFIRVHADWIDSLNSQILNNWIVNLIINRFYIHPYISSFEYDREVLLFDFLNFSLIISNHNNASFVYEIEILSQFFEDINISNSINPDSNMIVNFNISCISDAIPGVSSLIFKLKLNNTPSNNKIEIYNRNLSIKIKNPYKINLTIPSNNIFPGEKLIIYLDIYNNFNHSIDINILVISPNYLNEIYELNDIKPGFNHFNLELSISWISYPGNISFDLISYHQSKIITINQGSINVKNLLENPFFILLLVSIAISTILIISFFIYFRKRYQRNKLKVYNYLKKNKKLDLTKFCKENHIGFNRISKILNNLALENENLKYLVKYKKNKIKMMTKDEFKKYLATIIDNNDSLSFSNLKSKIFTNDNELAKILEDLI